MDIKIEWIAPEDVKLYENNPRHNDEAVKPVANSIREFGFLVPVVLDKDNCAVAGETRIKAARDELKLPKIPFIRAAHLTDDQIRAFRLADNKVGEIAEWDFEKQAAELEAIAMDMAAFGFDALNNENFIDDLLNTEFIEARETDFFEMTFVFEKKHKDARDNYVAAHGRERIVKMIVEAAEGEQNA